MRIQWAAVMTHCRSIKTPPHQWPTFPAWGWISLRDTCHGHSPGIEELPPTIRSVKGESLLYLLYPHSKSRQEKSQSRHEEVKVTPLTCSWTCQCQCQVTHPKDSQSPLWVLLGMKKLKEDCFLWFHTKTLTNKTSREVWDWVGRRTWFVSSWCWQEKAEDTGVDSHDD